MRSRSPAATRIATASGAVGTALAALAFAGCAATSTSSAGADAAIRSTLVAFPAAFAARDAEAACGLFTADAVLVYPGTADRTQPEFCAQLERQFASEELVVAYDPPEIQEIVVAPGGDQAAVRLVWTGTATRSDGTVERIREQGLDVLRRDDDGVWRIRISQAFPLEPAG